jgi:acyl-CoA thioester hydrolase
MNETISELRVRYAETDQMGVVYHTNYLVWCEIGRTDFIRNAGRTYAELERDGVRLAVSDATIRFHASARYDDPIAIHTRLVDLRSRAMRFAYRVFNADSRRLLASASTTLISIDDNARLVRLPDFVRDALHGTLGTEFEHAT